MPTLKRSLRTLVLFVEQFVQAGGRASGLRHLTVTLPKVTNEAQVNGLVEILEKLESIHQLGDNFFDVELLIETPQAFLDTIGNIPLPRLIAAGKGRCVGIHFGVYDFTSSIGIGSAGQSIDHFACDAARFLMHLSAAAVPGVMVSDGIVNLLPIPIHRSTEGLYSSLGLSETQIAENKLALANAWRINFEQMSRSLRFGCYQGWDLHPSQIAIRHVVNRAYVLREFDAAALRLKGFLDRSAQASTFGSTFDDRASARGLVHFMKRALSSGIITAEALNQQGIAIESLSNL
ncbi:MAG: hypothetical protein NTV34_03465 [Proteobacteria bacterium]|nr:hypothetical protein [Pseudomonadota bacterium]